MYGGGFCAIELAAVARVEDGELVAVEMYIAVSGPVGDGSFAETREELYG